MRGKAINQITASFKKEKNQSAPRVYLFTQQIFIQDLLYKEVGIYAVGNKKDIVTVFVGFLCCRRDQKNHYAIEYSITIMTNTSKENYRLLYL